MRCGNSIEGGLWVLVSMLGLALATFTTFSMLVVFVVVGVNGALLGFAVTLSMVFAITTDKD